MVVVVVAAAAVVVVPVVLSGEVHRGGEERVRSAGLRGF